MGAMKANPGKRTVAIISGKGGSGKTLIAAETARIFAETGGSVALVDADLGTGGLSYYLALNFSPSIGTGLVDLFFRDRSTENFSRDTLKPLQRELLGVQFLPVGSHRRLDTSDGLDWEFELRGVFEGLLRDFESTIVDCRGGIDRESLAVCRLATDIIIVMETDITSLLAAQRVSECVKAAGQHHKLRGFILNKAFDNPSSLVHAATASLGCPFLGAIPFDIETTKRFTVGELPKESSLFSIHLSSALNRAFDFLPPPLGRAWRLSEFREVGIADIDSRRGSQFAVAALLVIGISYASNRALLWDGRLVEGDVVAIYFFVLGLISAIEPLRRFVGRAIGGYLKSASVMMDTIRRFVR